MCSMVGHDRERVRAEQYVCVRVCLLYVRNQLYHMHLCMWGTRANAPMHMDIERRGHNTTTTSYIPN